MNILVTGADGFVGRNLVRALENIQSNKDQTRPGINIENIYSFDKDTDVSLLDGFCENADFVFNFAGVNRPKDESEFMQGNLGFARLLLDKLKEHSNNCPIVFSSSIQASLKGRYAESEYGKSKLAGEKLFFEYEKSNNARVLVYRFSNLFGKWCRPNYNSAVATFCHNISRGIPITINNPETELELIYIDDLVCEMLDALEGREHRNGKFCCVPVTYRVTLKEIADLLYKFKYFNKSILMTEIPPGSFEKKLYSTYISYLPPGEMSFPLEMHKDNRGSFTEILKTFSNGQLSVNVSKPGVTKGEHWHNSKWEIFVVVSGHGLIRERRVDSDDVIETEVSGDDIRAVYMLPGYTHSIINLSDTQDLVTIMWANEGFDPDSPDTYRLPV